jgi:hypothetical protein
LWTSAEAESGAWHRGDKEPEPENGCVYLFVFVLHWVGGFFLLLIPWWMWIYAERHGWCSSDFSNWDSIQGCIDGTSTADGLRIFRSTVPILTAVWAAVAVSFARKREPGCITAPASFIFLATAFLLSIYMS